MPAGSTPEVTCKSTVDMQDNRFHNNGLSVPCYIPGDGLLRQQAGTSYLLCRELIAHMRPCALTRWHMPVSWSMVACMTHDGVYDSCTQHTIYCLSATKNAKLACNEAAFI